AHVFVVNKADRDGALRMKAELEQMLQLRPPAAWTVPVLLTEAHRDRGIDELVAAIAAHRGHVTTDGSAQRAAAEHRVREFLDVLGATPAGRIEARIGGAYARSSSACCAYAASCRRPSSCAAITRTCCSRISASTAATATSTSRTAAVRRSRATASRRAPPRQRRRLAFRRRISRSSAA